MNITNKTSLLIPSQLPSFISEDSNYENFVSFTQAYYEWMEQNGILFSIDVINGGLGYDNPTVTIQGDGSGATASVILNNYGSIQEIVIDSYGSGYTYANVTISGSSTIPATLSANIKNGITYDSKNLMNYMDINNTTQQFLNYFINDFMPFFPEDSLVSKDEAIKVAKQLYQSKGTPASYELLFRLLYNSSFDYFNTGDLVFKASSGQWYVPRSVSLLTTDIRFLQISSGIGSIGSYKLFGETSKAFGVIENCVLSGNEIEIFLSDVERTFQSGEYVRVVDKYNNDVIVNGSNISAKIVGQISSITINPDNRGLNYVQGNPVVVYGGLNPLVPSPIAATAVVGTTTTGSVQGINILTGGQGYNPTLPLQPESLLDFSTTQTSNYILPSATVTQVDTANAYTFVGLNTDTIQQANTNPNANPTGNAISLNAFNFFFANGTTITVQTTNVAQTYIAGETVYQGSSLASATFSANVLSYNSNTGIMKVVNIGPIYNANVTLSSALNGVSSGLSFVANNYTTANLNSRIGDVLSTESYTGSPLTGIYITNSGQNLSVVPTLVAEAQYGTQTGHAVLGALGVLGPVKIAYGGQGYSINDPIIFVGGSGIGANAYVSNVNSIGAITQIKYNSINNMPGGGMGYSLTNLPSVTANSSNPYITKASVYVDSIMGQGATFALNTGQLGQIQNIVVQTYGQDYISTPKVSLRVQDLAIMGVTSASLPQQGQTIYQGTTSTNATYVSTIYSVTQLGPTTIDPSQTLYRLRVYNYSNDPNPYLPLINSSTGNTYPMYNQAYDSTWNSHGIIDYGDGSAKATANFLNGLTIGQGQYLTSSGQLSGSDVLQDQKYNSFTYQITVQKEIEKYRSVLLNLLHPAGTNLIGRYKLTNAQQINFNTQQAINRGNTLYHYTQTSTANATMYADLNTTYSNTITFNNLPQGTNIAQFITANSSTIAITPSGYTPNIISLVTNVDAGNNKITIQDKVFLTLANTFYVQYLGSSNSNNSVYVTAPTGYYSWNDFYGVNVPPVQQVANTTNNLGLVNLLNVNDYIYLDSKNKRLKVIGIDYANNIIRTSPSLSSNLGVNQILVSSSGSGYTPQNTTIYITGDGYGASATPTINANGSIVSVTVNNWGYNYNAAVATVVSTDVGASGAYLLPVSLANFVSNNIMTIVKNVTAGGSLSNQQQIIIYGSSGIQYFPQITDELGDALETEDGNNILLG